MNGKACIQYLDTSNLADFSCDLPEGVVVVMPCICMEKGRKTAEILYGRANIDCRILVVHDSLRQGFIKTLNAAASRVKARYIVYLAEDAWPCRGWLECAFKTLEKSEKGLLAFNDGKWQGHIASFGMVRTAWVKKLYDGNVFYPGYISHAADNELTVIARAQNMHVYNPECVLVEVDPDKDRRGSNVRDRELFRRRFVSGFEGLLPTGIVKELAGEYRIPMRSKEKENYPSGLSIIISTCNHFFELDGLFRSFFNIDTNLPIEFIIVGYDSKKSIQNLLEKYSTKFFIRFININALKNYNISTTKYFYFNRIKANYKYNLFLDDSTSFDCSVVLEALNQIQNNSTKNYIEFDLNQKTYKINQSISDSNSFFGNNNDTWQTNKGIKRKSEKVKSVSDSKDHIVTIIIPIFNALFDALECIMSVIKHRTLPYQVIVLDDKSDEPGISAILKDFCEQYCFIKYLCNTVNLGYTVNINQGLKMAPNGDVILLNSDTKVTRGWVEKMAAAAYSRENVATVTPLSNAAGAFSIPENNTVNELAKGLGVEEYNRILEAVSRRERPEAPTGNGFCLYITRSAIDRLEGFDQERFPRGYGEENDFCQRAIKAGFVNLVDDSTFIFHKRNSSFQNEKVNLIQNAKKIISTLHPDYKMQVKKWLENEELKNLRQRFSYELNTQNFTSKNKEKNSRTILYILHDGKGGVRHTTNDLIKDISKHYNVLILICGVKSWKLMKYFMGSYHKIEFFRFSSMWSSLDRMDIERQNVITNIIKYYEPNIVHIRHFIGNEPEIISTCKFYNIPIVVSLHDLYVLCPTIQLQDATGKYCYGCCENATGPCPLLKKWFHNGIPDLKNNRVYQHRKRFVSQLPLADYIITTSNSTKNLILEHFSELLDNRFLVIEHGRNLEKFQFSQLNYKMEKIRIVAFGALGKAKGSNIIKYLLNKNYKENYPYEFHILGPGLGESKEIERLGGMIHGPYERENLPSIIKNISPALALILSTWPETYCHTLTEAWSMGLPVVASDIGALGERIRTHGGGWLVDFEHPVACWQTLREITKDHKMLLEKKLEAENIFIKSAEAMASDYLEIYEKVIPCFERHSGA